MRISDWSSDVCSSDLAGGRRVRADRLGQLRQPQLPPQLRAVDAVPRRHDRGRAGGAVRARPGPRAAGARRPRPVAAAGEAARGVGATVRTAARSEEHTSELQSLMRISYAVFCLKKNTPTNTHIINK